MRRPGRYSFDRNPSCRIWTMRKGGKHRIGGPAEEYDNGTKFYWVDGQLVLQEWGEFWRKWHKDFITSCAQGPHFYKGDLPGYDHSF